ncbi:hypothetical protein BV898_09394 [Hypsibius exemplaris]|uniref:DOMON domain-containing protein n=1 Tax=Hypsibius exemplaris TaxID=2072580 RepID=A0A1W0WMQ2_HYPEX|nr:hypothetical protein BV898_09394 [Hypsibius exemplaris]
MATSPDVIAVVVVLAFAVTNGASVPSLADGGGNNNLTPSSNADGQNVAKTGGEVCGTGGMVCIGLPFGCAGKSELSCDVLAKVGVTGPTVHIDLSAWAQRGQKLALENRWIAVGFSENGQMGKSPVVHCFVDAGKAQSKLTFNSNMEYRNIGWKDIDQTQLSAMRLTSEADTLSCSVNLNRTLTIKGLNFDLAGTKHSLIIATGPFVAGVIKYHSTLSPETTFPDSFIF